MCIFIGITFLRQFKCVLGSFGPGSFRPILVGCFGLNFFRSRRLRIIGRTIIWLFDEESSDVKGLFFKVPLGKDRTIIWLFDEESVGYRS